MSRASSRVPPSLAVQLGLVLVGLIAFALAVYGLVGHANRQRVLLAEASAELRNHATLVEAALEGAVERGRVDVLKERLEQLARADRILGLAAFDDGGRPILVTDHLEASIGVLGALARRVAAQGADVEERRDLEGAPTLLRTVTLTPASGRRVVAVVARDLTYVDVLASSLNRGLALTGALLLLATGLVVGLVCRAMVGRPAGAIVGGVERVASGDLAANVPEHGARELSQLARAFNAMTVAMRDARERAERDDASRCVLERKLHHARALAAVGQVAASIAHEVGSPLNVILGRARRSAAKPDCPEALRQELVTIAEQSERISRVVASLLSVARPSKGAESVSDARRVIDNVVTFLGSECRHRGIRVEVDACPEAVSLAIEADQFFQILLNLCVNAIEAQPKGGRLAIRLRRDDAAGSRRAVLEVEDGGPGVPADIASRIFEPFFTTKADRSGSGLGLDIASGIARDVGGALELTSPESGGACFRLTLPLALNRQSDRARERVA